MKLIFIRHGDPDYVHDSLTEKGIREAKLLAERTAKWNGIVTAWYCSPLGRAKETASYTMEKVHGELTVCPWLREFSYGIDDPTTGRHGVPWDFMPEYWTNIPDMYDKDHWKDAEIYHTNPELLPAYKEAVDALDALLASYGYKRYQNYYITKNSELFNDISTSITSEPIHGNDSTDCNDDKDNAEPVLVFFCHMGITMMLLGHLLGFSPTVLLQSFYLAPTSVTILGSEERMPGKAAFRAQILGDVSHLQSGGEPISPSGYFTEIFPG